MSDKNWSLEETIIAFNLYCKIPFKNSSKSHPEVIKYARLLGRSPSAVNMKIGNLGRLDPSLQQKGITGLTHGSRIEKEVWERFRNNPEMLIYESERLIAEYSQNRIEDSAQIDRRGLPEGKERMIVVKQRINQSFFRSTVLSAYNFVCCISGVGNPQLLDACHIADWAENETNRTNPSNGLCMNPFFHRAYDKYFIAITPDYKIIISDELMEKASKDSLRKYLESLDGEAITMPDKFMPDRNLLDAHYTKFKNRL